jgi:prophage regulatory protein
MSQKLYRIPEVLQRLNIARTTLYCRIRDQTFVPAASLGGRVVVWPAHEVDTLVTAYIAGEPPDAIRALVSELLANRKRGMTVPQAPIEEAA